MPDDLPICVIDDDESVRLSLEGLIRSLGHAVRVFASAEDFLASPAHRGCACIISDVHMTGLSGIELQAAMKARGIATPFIFITAYGNDAMQTRAMNGGATCFLRKPFDAQALIDCLARALATR